MLKDLAEQLKKAREEQETLAKMKKENDARLKSLEEEIIMEMINTGQASTKFEDVGRLTVKKGYAGRIANKETFFKYLRESGQAHLIDEQVHWQRLQSWMNEINQEELPKAHEAGLDYYEKTILSFTKA